MMKFIEIPILRQYLPVNFVSGSVPVCFMSVNLSPSLYSVYLLHVFFVSLSPCLPVYCFFFSLFYQFVSPWFRVSCLSGSPPVCLSRPSGSVPVCAVSLSLWVYVCLLYLCPRVCCNGSAFVAISCPSVPRLSLCVRFFTSLSTCPLKYLSAFASVSCTSASSLSITCLSNHLLSAPPCFARH